MRTLGRFIRICFILTRYGLNDIIIASRWFSIIRFLKIFNPWYWITWRKLTRGERIRIALEKLGPIFIKFGQLLSTRYDLLPEDIVNELAKLQDRVPPFKGKLAVKIIEASLEQPLTEVFDDFNETPMASASIAQVHEARLKDGTEVIIKVLRPHIKKVIKKDLSLLKLLAMLTERYWHDGARFKPKQILKDFEITLQNELNLMNEAANASQLRRNFLHSPELYIPEIFWPYCRAKIMVMEKIHGTPIYRINTLKEDHVNLKLLAERGVEVFFTQVFRDSFFHADMHPGNLFVSKHSPESPQYIAVDFGIMGSLSNHDKLYLAQNLLAFFNRDYHRVAQLHVDSGWVPEGTRVDQFESAIRMVCEPIFEKPLKDISFGQLLVRLFQAASQFNMPVQPQLVLLQKTLLHVEGLGRQLYPDLDVWVIARPFIEKWIKQQVGPKAFLKNMRKNIPQWLDKLPEIPGLVANYLERSAHIPQQVFSNTYNSETQKINTRKAKRRGFLWGITSTFLFSAIFSLLYFSHGANWATWSFFILSGSFFIVTLLAS